MITWVTLVLGEMDVAWVNPYRSDQGTSSAPGLICTPLSVAVTQFWRGGDGRYEIGHLPGGRLPPGPDYVGYGGMVDDVRRGQMEGLDGLNSFSSKLYENK